VNSIWQLALEHLGVAISAISGVLAARGKRIDLFGGLVLALVTAFGGGTVRDVLVGDLPPVWLRVPNYLLNATVAAVAAFLMVRLRTIPRNVLLLADAGALALFTMIGTRKGVAMQFSASICVLLGVVTGVTGGILRDVLTGEVPLVFQPEIHLYATAALAGAAAFVLLRVMSVPEGVSLISGAGLVLGLRLAGLKWKLSLPVLEGD
jgi:uncharacterized membrane protein YeiH